jgi:hypothetical protein
MGLDVLNEMYGCGLGWGAGKVAQVAEWLMAADCKSATQRVTEVRILPCAPRIERLECAKG